VDLYAITDFLTHAELRGVDVHVTPMAAVLGTGLGHLASPSWGSG
jgi:hypothetical protein